MTDLRMEFRRALAKVIAEETGFGLDDKGEESLDSLLDDLAQYLNFADAEALGAEVASRGMSDELRNLALDLVTRGSQKFFQEEELFDFVKSVFLLKVAKSSSPIRIWCVNAGNGQMPSSLAISLKDAKDRGISFDCEIVATDFDPSAVDRAASRTFSHVEVQRGLSTLQLLKNFEQVEVNADQLPRYRIKNDFSKVVTYKVVKLSEELPDMGEFDLIVYHGSLGVQKAEVGKQLISRIAGKLKPNGYLAVGRRNAMIPLDDKLKAEVFGKAKLFKLKAKA